MIKFFLGFVAAIALAVLASFCYARFGIVDPRADIQPGSLEESLAMPALDAAVDRRAVRRISRSPSNKPEKFCWCWEEKVGFGDHAHDSKQRLTKGL